MKRKVHRSLDHGCKFVDQGRDASLEELPVAHEAWVLVVEGSGKQKSVVRIVLVPRGKSQDELQGGQLARSKPSLR